jgi:hypothetical protein
VFDHGASGDEAAEIVMNPPIWTDSFYDYQRVVRKRNLQVTNPEPPLAVLIDVPYFADSRHVGMLQVADLFAYLLRHYAELSAGNTREEYAGELDKVGGWAAKIAALLAPDNFRWKATGGCACSNFFRDIAPNALLQLHKKPPIVATARSLDSGSPVP